VRSLLVVIALAGVAYADDKPWAKDVPADKQHDALAIYQKGNGFFEQAQYKEAYEQYRTAIALWDHPAIRYNAAICLFNMDRPVEAYENLLAALRFGEAPLGGDLYKQGLNYKKLLASQVAELEVQSEDAGADVSLDGKHLFDAPGAASLHVTTKDTHQLVATKPGYETEKRALQLKPGAKTTLVIKLKPLPAGRRLVRRWPKWTPWAVLAGGAAVGLAGGGVWLDARAKFDAYNDDVAATCSSGCYESAAQKALKDRAYREAGVSYGVLALGGAGLVADFVMIVLNQPHFATQVTPSVGADHVGLAISGAW